jgi:hypothetical protein
MAVYGQPENEHNEKEYKNKDQFEKFQKKRKFIGAWQINKLKKGALVIKLRTNKNLIDQLDKAGQKELAEKKRIETAVINKTTMLAFMDKYKFSKLYFIYSNSGDSLLNGVRKGIFLDTNLRIDPLIEMPENFYLIAERDRVYNSSIGFVPEDSARKVKEAGNSSGYDILAVVKNKYGHQLKKPFPYECGYGLKNSGTTNNTFIKAVPVYYFLNESYRYSITIDKTQIAEFKAGTKKEFKKAPPGALAIMLSKELCYEVISLSIDKFNSELEAYYQGSPAPQDDKTPAEVKPFLY